MMFFSHSVFSIIEVLLVILPVLIGVAFVTVAERKTMASMQRRLGPNIVGWYGLLQAFADALKLILKEYVSPTQANLILFFLGPIITLIFALLGYAVIPFGPGLALADFNLGILYMLAVSSISTYGILLAGWSANSKYAFLGSLRSTAQLISYELILSSAILLVILFTGSLNISAIVEAQKAIWFIVPLFPVFIIFFIGALAETNRAPMDLAEAESELVSGFMTEHAASIFVFFFLAEYASILLMSILTTILFLGGYTYPITPLIVLESVLNVILPLFWWVFIKIFSLYDMISVWLLSLFNFEIERIIFDDSSFNLNLVDNWLNIMDTPVFAGCFAGIILGIKTCLIVFTFIWVRASFPRIRYDQLMTFCWTVLLPILFAFIILIPCVLYSFDSVPVNLSLLIFPALSSSYHKNKHKKLNKLQPISGPYRNLKPLQASITCLPVTTVTGIAFLLSATLSALYLCIAYSNIEQLNALQDSLLTAHQELQSAYCDKIYFERQKYIVLKAMLTNIQSGNNIYTWSYIQDMRSRMDQHIDNMQLVDFAETKYNYILSKIHEIDSDFVSPHTIDMARIIADASHYSHLASDCYVQLAAFF